MGKYKQVDEIEGSYVDEIMENINTKTFYRITYSPIRVFASLVREGRRLEVCYRNLLTWTYRVSCVKTGEIRLSGPSSSSHSSRLVRAVVADERPEATGPEHSTMLHSV